MPLYADPDTLPTPPVEEPDPNRPAVPDTVKTPFRTQLRLTEKQEAKMIRDTLTRIEEIKREMGLNPDNTIMPGSWMWLRQCHDNQYQNDLSFRKSIGTVSIFNKSNLTTGSGLRHVRFMSATLQDRLLGTNPFFACAAPMAAQQELAKQVEQLVQEEIENSNVRAAIREAQKVALYRNECVVKTGYEYSASPFVGEATVLVDNTEGSPEYGKPITTLNKGINIFKDDNFLPSPDNPALMMLETDPSFICVITGPDEVRIPAAGDTEERTAVYQYFDALPQVLVKKDGVTCKALASTAFLCPLRVDSIHHADCIAHQYPETPMRLQEVYGGIDVSRSYFDWWGNPDKPKVTLGEGVNPTSAILEQITCAEIYRTCDPDETGQNKEIFMVMDLTNRKIIYYNYMANHMAQRPFEVICGIERITDRWYGRGVLSLLVSHLLFEDTGLNRAVMMNSKASTVTFADRSAVEDWQSRDPEIGTDAIYFLNPNWIPDGGKKPIWRENLAEPFTDENLQMLNVIKNAADAMVGAISTTSAEGANLNVSNTATTAQLIAQDGDVLAKQMEVEQTEAINEILWQVVDVVLEHMDPQRLLVMEHTDQLVILNRNEARKLKKVVRLLLTKARSTALLANTDRTMQILDRYRALMLQDPAWAKITRDQYLVELKALDAENADALLPEITDEMIQAAQQKQPPPEVSHSVSAKLEDFVGDERAQVVAQFGITPATPNEVEKDEQEDRAEKVADTIAVRPPPPPKSDSKPKSK